MTTKTAVDKNIADILPVGDFGCRHWNVVQLGRASDDFVVKDPKAVQTKLAFM
jgi:hypothetical protein